MKLSLLFVVLGFVLFSGCIESITLTDSFPITVSSNRTYEKGVCYWDGGGCTTESPEKSRKGWSAGGCRLVNGVCLRVSGNECEELRKELLKESSGVAECSEDAECIEMPLAVPQTWGCTCGASAVRRDASLERLRHLAEVYASRPCAMIVCSGCLTPSVEPTLKCVFSGLNINSSRKVCKFV